MRAFLDFEATSLRRNGTPIEIGWVFEDGEEESHLIRPAPGWTDWDPAAEAIHHIGRDTLLLDGVPHDRVAARMMERLGGHELLASAPSWDGKWLSVLLRAADFPRHALRLRDSDDAFVEIARETLGNAIPAEARDAAIADILTRTRPLGPPAHRALADARAEQRRWHAVRAAAEAMRAGA